MDENELGRYLDQIRGKRGYLLPHHGLMAVSMPQLLETYDALYTTLALTPRHLSRHDHEFVWLGILIAKDEIIGTHHIKRFHEGGGTNDELDDVLAVTAFARGCRAYHFVNQHWMAHLPDIDPERMYADAFRRAAGKSSLQVAHMTACSVHTCLGDWEGLRWQLRAAYADGTDEQGLAEALSLAMFPGSVPHYVEAADIWRQMIAAGELDASPLFRRWAEVSGQGGFDEATGVTGEPK